MEVRTERLTLNRVYELPWRLSKGQLQWLEKLKQSDREKIRSAAEEQWNRRYVPRQRTEDVYADDDDDWMSSLSGDSFLTRGSARAGKGQRKSKMKMGRIKGEIADSLLPVYSLQLQSIFKRITDCFADHSVNIEARIEDDGF